MSADAELEPPGRGHHGASGDDPARARRSSVKRNPGRRWFWRFMLVLGVALAIDFFIDDKLIFAGLALIWILACFLTLSRLGKSRQAP